MKSLLSTLVLSFMVFASITSEAATMREKKTKEEMLKRVDAISLKIESIRADLDDEKVKDACAKIQEIFIVYKDHVNDVGVHLDPFDSKTAEARNDSLSELISVHQEKANCERGVDSEFVDPKELSRKMKSINKSLKRQRKIIEKKSAAFENNFQYEYEF